jgi:hypothetical protein
MLWVFGQDTPPRRGMVCAKMGRMEILPVLFWVLLIICALGAFFPSWPAPARFGPAIVLFVILGLRVFPLVLK